MIPAWLNPIRLFVDGWNWRKVMDRRDYWGTLLWFSLPLLVFSLAATPEFLRSFWGKVAIFGVAAISIPTFGYAVKRFRDIGWRGVWAAATMIPGVGFVVTIILAFPKSRMARPAGWGFGWGMALVALIPLVLLGRMFFFEAFWLPTGSMKPGLVPGDYVIGLKTRSYERGDVIVFRHPATGLHFIKRLIGMPGDRVQLIDDVVHVNGEALPRQQVDDYIETFGPKGPVRDMPRCREGALAIGAVCSKRQMVETLPNGRAYPVLQIFDGEQMVGRDFGNTPEMTVPAGHVFVLGDNRDNSADSRLSQLQGGVGMLPMDRLEYRLAFRILNISTFDRFLEGVK